MEKIALICEDNLTTAHCISNLLNKKGYVTEIVQNAESALEKLKNNKYDLMTLDIILPQKSGVELLEEMQAIELAHGLPVLIVSALEQQDDSLAFQHNPIYWVEKSFDTVEFEKAIENLKNINDSKKAKVLHVENDTDLLSLVELTLSDIAEVTQASTLKQAKNMLETENFDLIILDYVFPEGTSDKLLPVIKSGLNKDSHIVMHSAYEEAKIIAHYVDEIIIKSKVSIVDFKDRIEKYIVKG